MIPGTLRDMLTQRCSLAASSATTPKLAYIVKARADSQPGQRLDPALRPALVIGEAACAKRPRRNSASSRVHLRR
jgi:hypothetical protein